MTTLTQSDPFGSKGGDALQDVRCPTGTYVNRIGARSGWATDYIKFGCSDNSSLPSVGVQGGGDDIFAGDNFSQSNDGFTGMRLWSGWYLDGFQPLDAQGNPAKQVRGSGNYNAQFKCPTGQVLVGIRGSRGWNNDVDSNVPTQVSFYCNYPVDCTAPGNASDARCLVWCTANADQCERNKLAWCQGAGRMDTVACRTFAKQHSTTQSGPSDALGADVDHLVNTYCSTTKTVALSAAKDYFCGCYQTLDTTGIPAAVANALNANKLCNPNCTNSAAYQYRNIGSVCSLNIQQCIQNIDFSNAGALQAGQVNLSSNCSLAQGGNSGTGSDDVAAEAAFDFMTFIQTNMLVIAAGIAGVLFIVLIVGLMSSKKSKRPRQRK